MPNKNKEINEAIRAKAGRKVSKIEKNTDPRKNQSVNDLIRSRAKGS